MSDSIFAGFSKPKSNYSKLPHELIDELPNINSLSELKVILYILRHTWGFSDSEKRITIDEFCNGRKRADGTRIDGGCGISPNSVRSGLDSAVQHGYIVVEEDARDLARIKRFYSINSGVQALNAGVQELNAGVQELNPRSSKVEPRTEKETIERNLEKKEEDDGESVKPATRGDVHSLWQSNMPGTLTQILVDDLDDLVDTYGAEEVTAAITMAVRNNGRSIRYVAKILENRAVGKDKQPAREKPKSGEVMVFNQYTGQMEKVTV